MDEDGHAEPSTEGARLRVRHQTAPTWPEPEALAKAWEADLEVRHIFRQNRANLLAWPSPKLVGVASMKALAMNIAVIKVSLVTWGSVTEAAKTMPIDWLKQEAYLLNSALNIRKLCIGVIHDRMEADF